MIVQWSTHTVSCWQSYCQWNVWDLWVYSDIRVFVPPTQHWLKELCSDNDGFLVLKTKHWVFLRVECASCRAVYLIWQGFGKVSFHTRSCVWHAVPFKGYFLLMFCNTHDDSWTDDIDKFTFCMYSGKERSLCVFSFSLYRRCLLDPKGHHCQHFLVINDFA